MPDQPLKIMFITAEAAPMASVGGLATFGNSLPKALRALGHDVRVMLPAYGTLDRAALKLKPYGAPFAINLGYEPQVGTIMRGTLGNVPVYYVDHAPTFSERPAIYTDATIDAARFAIFSTLALTVMSHLNWQPDVVHLNDWHTALMARWLHNLRAVKFSRPTVLTIHNLEHQGVAYRPDLGWAGNLVPWTADQIVNYMYEGIAHADIITTVSPAAREMITPEGGAGLDQVLRTRSDDLYGVLDGVDADNDGWSSAAERYAELYSRAIERHDSVLAASF